MELPDWLDPSKYKTPRSVSLFLLAAALLVLYWVQESPTLEIIFAVLVLICFGICLFQWFFNKTAEDIEKNDGYKVSPSYWKNIETVLRSVNYQTWIEYPYPLLGTSFSFAKNEIQKKGLVFLQFPSSKNFQEAFALSLTITDSVNKKESLNQIKAVWVFPQERISPYVFNEQFFDNVRQRKVSVVTKPILQALPNSTTWLKEEWEI